MAGWEETEEERMEEKRREEKWEGKGVDVRKTARRTVNDRQRASESGRRR